MGALCYTRHPWTRDQPQPGGVHLTEDGLRTLCGLDVIDVPEVPRTVGPLTCHNCHRSETARFGRAPSGNGLILQEIV